MISDDRVCSFHEGQIWESPRGTYYKVVKSERNGQAILKQGTDGSGSKIKRPWDAVVNWVLYKDGQ